jgi:transcriptional regulator PpsR
MYEPVELSHTKTAMDPTDEKLRVPLESIVDSPVAARVIESASEATLVVDRAGVIVGVSLGDGMPPHAGWAKLVGNLWTDTLTIESRSKVEPLIAEAREGKASRRRELNQVVDGIGEVPMRYTAVRLDDDADRILVLGRDLRPLATLQQRMVAAQQSMDREFARLREADRRYRVLFHLSSEGVLIADGQTKRVLEVNPAAASMLGETANALEGRAVGDLVHPQSRDALQTALAAAEAGTRVQDIEVALEGQDEAGLVVSISAFRQGGALLLLVRIAPRTSAAPKSGTRSTRMLAAIDALPDGFVVVSEDGRILHANAAFCDLVQRATETQVVGEPLDRWLGRPGVDFKIILGNLQEHGSVRNFATIVRGDFGPLLEAVVTAVSALDGKLPCVGVSIRAVPARASVGGAPPMGRSVEQLRELVGRVPLKDLVRESADLIEKLCIEAALDVSGNNRASAAQLLGLSRQGLYSKLRRYGIPDLD